MSAILTGIAWYRREQYPLLLALSTDADNLAKTYDEWLSHVNKTREELEARGLQTVPVDVDVKELVEWCRRHEKEVDGGARAQFVSAKLSHLS
jgi:hypothetical protein